MAPELYPEFFNDVFGPVMQPGSSSHTAAPCRLAYLANNLLGEMPHRIQVILDRDGSFAGTFGAMSEDSAMVAGAMGFLPDDERLYAATSLARESGIDISFEFGEMKESAHINAMKFILTAADGREVSLVGDSTGGGMIETQVINNFPLRLRGDSYVLLLLDLEGELSSKEYDQLQTHIPALVEAGRTQAAGKTLYFFKSSESPDIAEIWALFPELNCALLKPVLPVLTGPRRRPQLFKTMTRWREIARERRMPLWEVAVAYEMAASGWTRERVIEQMRTLERLMYRQTHAAYEEDLPIPKSPFKPNMAADWKVHLNSPFRLTDDLTADTLKWAYGAGAGIPGVPVVAGPMGSGGGYIHAALWAVKKFRGFSHKDLIRGLFIAAGVGALAFTRTEPTGECIGCTGECGVCGAMAAAGITEMAGGSPEQVENAASMSLQSAIGIPCDPIPGGAGQPCRSRIISAVCTAAVYADLALCGRDAVLPLHEAIDVADAVGRRLPAELLCTSRGGAAIAPAAQVRATDYQEWFEMTQREGIIRPPGNLI